MTTRGLWHSTLLMFFVLLYSSVSFGYGYGDELLIELPDGSWVKPSGISNIKIEGSKLIVSGLTSVVLEMTFKSPGDARKAAKEIAEKVNEEKRRSSSDASSCDKGGGALTASPLHRVQIDGRPWVDLR